MSAFGQKRTLQQNPATMGGADSAAPRIRASASLHRPQQRRTDRQKGTPGGELFVLRDGEPYAVNVETGLTDLDYSEVVSGIDPSDEIILLPSAGLIRSQDRFRQFADRFSGVPGITGGNSD